MTKNELLEYLIEKGLEYPAINMAMFNDIGFHFIPVVHPIIYSEGGLLSFCGGEEPLNLLSAQNNQYACFSPEIADKESFTEEHQKLMNLVNRMCMHPEHLYAYTARYKDEVWGYYIYNRKSTGIEEIRNLIILDFIEQASITSIAQLHRYIEKSFVIRNKLYDVNKVTLTKKIFENGVGGCMAPALLFDEKFTNSLKKNEGNNEAYVRIQYFARLLKAENDLFTSRYIPINTSFIYINDNLTNKISGIGFQTQFKQLIRVKTDIHKKFTIVNRNDSISDIILNIILELNAKSLEFYAATGYAFESGLNMLETAYQALMWQRYAGKGSSKVELIVGALQNYNGIKKINELNYATAEKLNLLIEEGIIEGVYTYVDAFYHGKFYYISNGDVSYVITGSSNITKSAYCNNYELDVMYRFERENGLIDELETSFVAWYQDLRSKCIMFSQLDSNLFPRNINVDEMGTKLDDVIRREISEPEEQMRYDTLMSYHPAKIDEKTFKNRRDMRPFKGYIAFEYPQYELTVLESFEFGNACYIFGICNINVIRNILVGRTKEDVKKSDLYLAHIEHNENYVSILKEILDLRKMEL